MQLYGVATIHPRGEDSDFNGYRLRDNEMTEFARKMEGNDLCLEHNLEDNIGKVVYAWKREDGNGVDALFRLHTSDFRSTFIGAMIANGEYPSVSIGQEAEQHHDPETGYCKIGEKNPYELSICVNGALPDTNIHTFFEVDENGKKHSIFVRDINNNNEKKNKIKSEFKKIEFSEKSLKANKIKENNKLNKMSESAQESGVASTGMDASGFQARLLKEKLELDNLKKQLEDERKKNEEAKQKLENDRTVIDSYMKQKDAEEKEKQKERLKELDQFKEWYQSICAENPELLKYAKDIDEFSYSLATVPDHIGMHQVVKVQASRAMQNINDMQKLLEEKNKLIEQNQAMQKELQSYNRVSKYAFSNAMSSDSKDATVKTTASAGSSSNTKAPMNFRRTGNEKYDFLVETSKTDPFIQMGIKRVSAGVALGNLDSTFDALQQKCAKQRRFY